MFEFEKTLSSLDITFTAQRGEEIQGLCPMHKKITGKEDRNPSWWINANSGMHLCFSCGYKGNIFTLVSDLKGIDYFDAKDFVAQGSQVDVDVLLRRIRELPQYISENEEIGMSEARLAVYDFPPEKELRKRFLKKEAVERHGVLWDTKNKSWILPIRDSDNFSLLGWQEKGLGRFFNNQPTGVKKSKTVFGVQLMKLDEQLVVVESPLDAVRLTGLGYNAVATFGAIISLEQIKLIRGAVKVIAAFDNDEAGHKANKFIQKYAKEYGINLFYFNYTGIDVKDVGDMAENEIHKGITTSKISILGKMAYGS